MNPTKKPHQPTTNTILPLLWHAAVRLLLEIGKPPFVLLIGEPGTGKSTIAQFLARQITGMPPAVISGTPESDLSQIWGRWHLVGEETRFVDGPLPAALKKAASNKGCWCLFEEYSIVPIEVRSTLLGLRLLPGDQEEMTNPLNGEVIPIPTGFRLICTSNWESHTCRKNAGINKALQDGLLPFEVPELEDEQVKGFLRHAFPNATEQRIGHVHWMWKDYRTLSSKGSAAKSHLSVRAAMHLMSLLEKGMSEIESVQISLVNKLMTADADLFAAAKLKNSISNPNE